MKRLLIKLFFRAKFVGQIASAIASLVASGVVAFLFTYLLNAPEWVSSAIFMIVGLILEVPEGTVLTPAGVAAGLVAILTPFFITLINGVVQNYVTKDNVTALKTLTAAGVYSADLDWVGPVANEGIERLVAAAEEAVSDGLAKLPRK